MPRRLDKEDYLVSETGNWNVAADYSKNKIMKPLALADEYSTIARFGTSNLIEELIDFDVYSVDQLRLRGLEWLIDTLITLIDNSITFVKGSLEKNKEKGDKKKLKEYRDKLKKIESILPALSRVMKKIKGPPKIVLNIKEFEKVLEIVRKIKSDINEPLNNNDLIFTNREEFDPKAYKESIKRLAIERG